jgi:hypothetical protein
MLSPAAAVTNRSGSIFIQKANTSKILYIIWFRIYDIGDCQYNY